MWLSLIQSRKTVANNLGRSQVSQLQGPARSLDLACLTGSNRQLLADAKAALAALRRNAEPATSSTGTSASRKRSKDGAWVRFEQGNKDQEMTYECVTSL